MGAAMVMVVVPMVMVPMVMVVVPMVMVMVDVGAELTSRPTA